MVYNALNTEPTMTGFGRHSEVKKQPDLSGKRSQDRSDAKVLWTWHRSPLSVEGLKHGSGVSVSSKCHSASRPVVA